MPLVLPYAHTAKIVGQNVMTNNVLKVKGSKRHKVPSLEENLRKREIGVISMLE